MKKLFKVTVLLSITICFLAFLTLKAIDVMNENKEQMIGSRDAEGNISFTRYEDLREYYPSLALLVEEDYQRLYNFASSCTDSFDISGRFTIKDEEFFDYWVQANMAVNDVLVQAQFDGNGKIYVQTAHHSNIDDTPYDVYAKAMAKVIGVKEGQLIAAAKSLYDDRNTKEFAEFTYDYVHGNLHYINGTCYYYFTFEK